ncbi:sigma-70 family RNA polymerase sigma factor [Aeromicrobium duanguangcaii]|uniref:Sigma-70 family RNA polymerase sigma factor n=1 Tax=Aeromicrobium duanguangcaii TaxID=2968086 RepID=A0ABY5KHC0_9ACTN|nr:sigma-70 family RNA polymerase sigma factor [Aeromicrobium duanguangcaii]MCD9154824.1 sigma-70 family RNA polymerase sigma factor [Aeromicrobium duanguangcaii]MCL3838952.1 sigma-70 family RNA polymerase sigma factor [Aeromicrobium duanguangcaii]UUI67763.1 sigma-70 family RNA polymerase sigma factor [Aeromicrobium duanguangcaii]
MTALYDHPPLSAPDDLVLDHLSLATALARRFSGRGVDPEDLEQVARLALVKAARRYDPDQGPFPPFATATIQGELKRHFRDRAWMVRPPRRVQEVQALIVSEQLPEITSANLEQMAARIGVVPEELRAAVVARGCFQPDSVDDLSHGRREFAHTDDNLDFLVEWMSVAGPLRELAREERQLLHWRFVEGLTQQAIADRLGISQMQVSRRLSKVLSTVRHHPDLAAA